KLYLQRLALSAPSPGTVLGVSESYLSRALDEFDVLGVALAATLAAKWDPDSHGASIATLNQVAYALLTAGRYRAAAAVSRIGGALGVGDTWLERALQVNEWIARK